MIANPTLKAYKYDPYDKQLTEEQYDYNKMVSVRKQAVDKAVDAGTFGIILGTLGRQGSVKVENSWQKLTHDLNTFCCAYYSIEIIYIICFFFNRWIAGFRWS